MKLACILITHLRAKAEMERRPSLRAQPVLIADRSRPKPIVADRFPAATAVSTGMILEHALARQPGAAVIEADEPHYRRIFEKALTRLQEVTGRVEDAELGVAYAALDGLEMLYGGEDPLAQALLDALPAYLAPRAGIGAGKFPALAAAMTAAPMETVRVPEDAAAFLANRSINLLPISERTITSMRRFGIHTLGQIAALNQNLMVDQFRTEGRWAWQLANGRDGRPLIPVHYEEQVTEETSLPFSSTSMELLITAVNTLLQRAYTRPLLKGRYAGRAHLECAVYAAASWEKNVNFQEGVGNWERAAFIIRAKLEAEPPEAPIDSVRLTLSHLTGESGAQLGLMPEARDRGKGRIAEVERRLQTRAQGTPALYRVTEIAPWHPAPEMRAVRVPLNPANGSIVPLMMPEPAEVQEDRKRQPEAHRTNGQWRRITRIADQWSFDLWWLPKPITRNYYRVEREDGSQTTLFLDQHQGRWYQQGR